MKAILSKIKMWFGLNPEDKLYVPSRKQFRKARLIAINDWIIAKYNFKNAFLERRLYFINSGYGRFISWWLAVVFIPK